MEKKKLTFGFSLMEIMISLIIIAIIAGIAYPHYKKMITRTRQTEAKTTLRALYMSQDLYKLNNLHFANDIHNLDIEIPNKAIYTYSIETSSEGQLFVAKAIANIDDDPTLDTWEINSSNTLTNTINDILE